MIPRSFDWRVVPIAMLVIVTAATSYGYHRILLAQRSWIEHTYQVMSTLETTLQLMTDAETGQRGYILTGDRSYLAPYSKALEEVGAMPARLRQLVHDSPVQLARVASLEHALKDKLEELASTIDIRERDGAARARADVSSNVGRERMDALRAIIARMRDAEADLLLARSARAGQTERALLAVTIGLAIVSVVARIGLYRLSVRSSKAGK